MHKRNYTTIGIITIVAVLGVILLVRNIMSHSNPVVEEIPENSHETTLVVVTDKDYCPYSFLDENGKPAGYDIELITRIANSLKMNLDLRLMTWSEGIAAVTGGEADVLMTCDVLDAFAGSDKLLKSLPTSLDDYVIYAREPVFVNDVNGKRIGVMKGGNVISQIKILGLTEYCIFYESNKKALEALIDGEVDAAVMRQDIGEVLLRELGRHGIEAYDTIGKSLMCFCTVNNKPELAENIDKVVKLLKNSGYLERLRKKWLTTFVRPQTLLEFAMTNLWIIFIVLCLLAYLIESTFRKHRQRQREKEIYQQQLQKEMDIIGGLATEYTALYHLDLQTGLYKNYLTADRVAETKRNFAKYDKFIDLFDNFVDSIAVHADSKESLHAFFRSDADVRAALKNKKKLSILFKRKYGDAYLWTEMIVVKCEKLNEEARTAVIGFEECDAEVCHREEARKKLEEALSTVTEERNRFMVVRELLNSGHWSFRLDEHDAIIGAEFFGDVKQVLNIDLTITPHAWEDILHPDDKAEAIKAFYATIADHSGRTPYDVIYRMRDQEGNYNWFRSAGKIIQQADGGREFFGVHINITKRIEQELVQQQRLEEALTFTDFFLGTYVSAYYVNIDDLSCEIYKRSEELAEEYPVIKNYTETMNEYLAHDVHPDDRASLAEIVDIRNIRKGLFRQQEITHVFRDISGGHEKTYRFQAIRGADEWHFAFCFMDITEELIEQNRRLKETEEARKLIENVASSYNVAFCVNLTDDSLKFLRVDADFLDESRIKTLKSFSEARTFLYGILHEADKARIMHELKDETIRAKLETVTAYNVEFCVVLDGVTSWHEMNITRIDKDAVAVGLAEKDFEITKRHLEDKRYDENFALFAVDMDTRKFKVIKNDEWYTALKPGMTLPYTQSIRDMAELLEGETKEFFLQLADLDYIKQDLAFDDKRTYSYKSLQLDGDKWIEVTGYVILRHTDGTPAMFTLGFSFIDALATAREELQEKLRKNHEIIQALSADYSSVYYIDIESEKFTPYSMNEETLQKMAKIFRSNELYPEAFKAYVEQFVYEPDREMLLREGRRTNIFEKLAHNKSFAITFRGLNDGRITFCEMKFVVAHKEGEKIKSIGLGFAYKDDEIMAQYINEKLVGEYISAFMVDLDNDKYRIYRHPNTTRTMDREDRIWSLAMKDFATECDPEYSELVRNIGTPEFLKAELADVDRREYLYRSPTTSKPWRRSVVQVLDRNHGVPSNIVATFMEIDDYQSKINDQQKQLEAQQRQLEVALEEAQSASKAKTDFLFNMSHDIRTPMNAIIGFTNMAIKHIDDRAKVSDSLIKTRESSELLLSLINNILDMSRIESGKIKLEMKAGDVYLSFMNIESTMQELAKAKHIQLTFAVSNIQDRYVYADFTRCARVFVNIITNAIKYTPDGGHVRVSCEQTGAQEGVGLYRYRFEDNGIGMSEEFQKHVFEAFTREETSTVSGIQGTGLGLAVCKTFVTAMNGTIELKSRRGEGTVFIVTLPFSIQKEQDYVNPANGQLVSAKPLSTSSMTFDFNHKRILLVEDNELNREIAMDILSEEGMEIMIANDGSEAVQIMKDKGADFFDFILMDIQMPVMNGYEATHEIRKMYPEAKIPIIALSANAFAEDKAASLAAGMNDHIAKPINVKILKQTLAKFL